MKGLHEIHADVLDAIAPANWRDMGIKSATLELTARTIPTLTLVCECIPQPGGRLGEITRRYELWPVPAAAAAPAFDLDEAIRQAQAQVARRIDASAKWHGYVLQTKFQVTRKRALARAPSVWMPALPLSIEGLL